MPNLSPKIKRFAKWLAILLLRTSIVLFAYLLFALIRVAETTLLATAWVGRYFDVRINTGIEEEQEMDFSQKFTEDEIDKLAKTVKETETIQEIEARLKVSYRQARKIKEASKNPLSIRHYSWEDKIA